MASTTHCAPSHGYARDAMTGTRYSRDGEVLGAMSALAVDLGISDVVEFAGWIGDPDLRRLLSTADVCIAPDPPSPLNDASTMVKIPEYMAMGRPIVSYDLIESRASAGDAALYATEQNPEGLGRCLDELLGDPERRRRMGHVATRRVEEALAWQHAERSLLAAYDRALEHGDRALNRHFGAGSLNRERAQPPVTPAYRHADRT